MNRTIFLICEILLPLLLCALFFAIRYFGEEMPVDKAIISAMAKAFVFNIVINVIYWVEFDKRFKMRD